jgi:hypothetical protein
MLASAAYIARTLAGVVAAIVVVWAVVMLFNHAQVVGFVLAGVVVVGGAAALFVRNRNLA